MFLQLSKSQDGKLFSGSFMWSHQLVHLSVVKLHVNLQSANPVLFKAPRVNANRTSIFMLVFPFNTGYNVKIQLSQISRSRMTSYY